MSPIQHRPEAGSPSGFRLDPSNAKLAGVCSGLANWSGIDPLIVRIIFVAGTLIGFGSFALAYLLIWLLAE